MQDTITLNLPVTKSVVTMKGYLTTGQSRQLQKILLSKGEFDAAAGAMKGIAPDTFLDMQDQAAELLITEVKNPDGTATVFTKEWLYELPMGDGNVVYEKVNEVMGTTSSLSDEGKKK